MIDAPLPFESRQAEQSKITANWLARMRQCMTDGDQPAIFADALRATGITSGDIESRANIEQRQLDEVLQVVLRSVPDISLRLFACVEISDLGVIGYAAINSDTVGKALSFLLRYHELTSDRYFDTITVEDDVAAVSPTPRMAHVQNFVNVAEDSMAGNCRMLQMLLGPSVDYADASVHFDFPEPDYVATYHEVFACPCHFEADRTELRFPAKWLGLPIASANQALADVCTAMCERLLGAGESSRETPQMVRRLLLSRPGRRMYRLEEAAEQLHLSVPQLRKRLYKAGTSYKRLALARHYLEDTNLAVQEVAYLLDYAQPAPFSRAFKSYFGVPPECCRQAALEEPGRKVEGSKM
jgi:AraC-like DNA-binding protein